MLIKYANVRLEKANEMNEGVNTNRMIIPMICNTSYIRFTFTPVQKILEKSYKNKS